MNKQKKKKKSTHNTQRYLTSDRSTFTYLHTIISTYCYFGFEFWY